MAALIDTGLPANALAPADPAVQEIAQGAASQHTRTASAFKSLMPELVKGAGFRGPGGNKALEDPLEVSAYATKATLDIRAATAAGYRSKASVVKSMNPTFLAKYGALAAALTRPSLGDQLQEFMSTVANPDVVRSFTAGNIGVNSVYGLTPFNLLAPSRLIYPVYTVYRNKFARVPSQGASTMERVFTGISGSQTGGQGVVDISLPELVEQGGSFGNWPLNLPPGGSQTMVPLNIPDRFLGITEQLSWLAQFAGQGYEDLAALANLIMLQEMMLGEEYMMIAGTSSPLSAPGTPTLTVRAAQSNETSVGANTDFTVFVTATNYFGQTTSAQSATVATSAGQVVDVTISASAAAMQYNIFVSTNASPTIANAWLMATTGSVKYTLQGTVPTSGSNPPAADTGTGKGTRFEGVIPTLTGQSAAAGIYPEGWQGGYVNNAVGSHLSINVVNTALKALIDAPGGSTTNGAFKADPAEIISSGTDIANLASDIISAGAANNYLLGISQDQTGNVTSGLAVTQHRNPITQSLVKLVWHPWYLPGSADLISYQLPQTWTNVGNAIEMQMVQDYTSISWPTIDATWRFSIFAFGAMVMHAPQYSSHLGGLANSDVPPYS